MSQAQKKVSQAIKNIGRARHLNFLVTETLELANSGLNNALKKGQEPFSVVVKDNFAVKDVPMTCGSAMLKNYIAPYTATCVRRLIRNGGCLLGKANMDEFAQGSTNLNSHFGPTLHSVHYPSPLPAAVEDFRIAGGSSGGSAVAVAIGVADIAIGSDTGGSTRNPAAFNGVVGFKPSYGRLSRHGLVPLANSLDTPSLFARTVGECSKYYEMIKGPDTLDSTSFDAPDLTDEKYSRIKWKSGGNLRGITIGIPKEYNNEELSADAGRTWGNAIKAFEMLGAKVREVSLPHTALSIVCYYILADSDVASNLARFDGVRFGHRTGFKATESFNEMLAESRTESLGETVRRRIFAGNFYTMEKSGRYYDQAARVRRLITMDFDAVFFKGASLESSTSATAVDALLTPTTAHSAPLFSQVQRMDLEKRLRDDFFTQPANMAGLPAISVPFGRCSDQLPLGVQLICPFGHDRLCLLLAEQLERFRSTEMENTYEL